MTRQAPLAPAMCGVILASVAFTAGAATERIACAAGSAGQHCDFTGDEAIQQAVDAALDGDTVLIRAGLYSPVSFRDVPFGKLAIRGQVVVDGKRLVLRGERGAILDGSKGHPASAIVARGAQLAVADLVIRNYRYGQPEDDLYDGHGLFFIDGHGSVANITIEKVQKMALTVRGTGVVQASEVRVLDGHVGFWLEETARLELRKGEVRRNDSAGICAYGDSSASIEESVFEANRDDGIFAADRASIEVNRSSIVRNAPFDFRAVADARISIRATVEPE